MLMQNSARRRPTKSTLKVVACGRPSSLSAAPGPVLSGSTVRCLPLLAVVPPPSPFPLDDHADRMCPGPDTVLSEPATDPQEKARDFARGVIEKKTMVQLALGFAVAVKHYLRYEEGIHYEDLYPLVNFIVRVKSPSYVRLLTFYSPLLTFPLGFLPRPTPTSPPVCPRLARSAPMLALDRRLRRHTRRPTPTDQSLRLPMRLLTLSGTTCCHSACLARRPKRPRRRSCVRALTALGTTFLLRLPCS